MFEYLYKYSPVHNVKAGVSYPATMVTTADHDDRVVPAHSFKYTAALQAADTGPAPKLIRIETNAGHGAGKPTSKIIEERKTSPFKDWADVIQRVPGIGDKRAAKLSSEGLTVNGDAFKPTAKPVAEKKSAEKKPASTTTK